MNRKILIVIVAVLAVILLAGVLMVLVLQNPTNGPDAKPSDTFTVANEDPHDVTDAQTPEITAPVMQPELEIDPTDAAETPTDVWGELVEDPEIVPTQKEENSHVPDETTKNTEPEEVTIPELPTEAGTVVPDAETLDYLKYHNMSGSEQAAFINTFSSVDAFFQWYNAAKKEYEDSLTEIDEDTELNLGDLVGGN